MKNRYLCRLEIQFFTQLISDSKIILYGIGKNKISQ